MAKKKQENKLWIYLFGIGILLAFFMFGGSKDVDNKIDEPFTWDGFDINDLKDISRLSDPFIEMGEDSIFGGGLITVCKTKIKGFDCPEEDLSFFIVEIDPEFRGNIREGVDTLKNYKGVNYVHSFRENSYNYINSNKRFALLSDNELVIKRYIDKYNIMNTIEGDSIEEYADSLGFNFEPLDDSIVEILLLETHDFSRGRTS